MKAMHDAGAAPWKPIAYGAIAGVALHAQERLEFGRASVPKSLTCGVRISPADRVVDRDRQPDEQAIRRACGRAREVFVYTYSGNSAQMWWNKVGPDLARCRNLTVIDLHNDCAKVLAALAQRGLQMQCLIQDEQVQIITDTAMVPITLNTRMRPRD
jgi:uncharacterized protein YaeQ